jgi:hypothetical protein
MTEFPALISRMCGGAFRRALRSPVADGRAPLRRARGVPRSGSRRLILAVALGLGAAVRAQDGEPIRVGVLHSLSGTMAISETTLKDTVLMLIAQQNERGGFSVVLSRPWSSIRRRTGPCLPRRPGSCSVREQVDVVFGCWTSVSRKSVLPVFEELGGLLFYPVQYEGEESSKPTSSTPVPHRTSRPSPPSTT